VGSTTMFTTVRLEPAERCGSIGAALFSLERFVLRHNAGGLFRCLPFLPYLALRSAALIGDTMNAATRIVEARRAADKRVLASPEKASRPFAVTFPVSDNR
jgi:hypothetical protein